MMVNFNTAIYVKGLRSGGHNSTGRAFGGVPSRHREELPQELVLL